MKKFIRLLAAVAGITAMFAFASCGSDDSEEKKSDLELAAEALTIADTVWGESINLPAGVAPYSDVTVTWVSSDTTIITYDETHDLWTVTAKDGTEFDTVTLTATLKEGENTITKEFTVKVPQTTAPADDETVLQAAIDWVKSYITTPVYAYNEFPFNGSIIIRGKTVTAKFTTDNEEAVRVPTDDDLSFGFYRDIYDQTAKITGTFTLGSASKQEEIVLDLPAVTKFESTSIYEKTDCQEEYSSALNFNPSNRTFDYVYSRVYTYTSGKDAGTTELARKYGFKGSYVLDPKEKTVSITVNKVCSTEFGDADTWFTQQGMLDYLGKSFKDMFKALKAFEDNPSLDTAYGFTSAMAFMEGGQYTREEFNSGICSGFGLTSIEDLEKAENAEIKERILNNFILQEMQMKSSGARSMGVDAAELPPKYLVAAMQAYESSKNIDTAIDLMVAIALVKQSPQTKNELITSICTHYEIEAISDFEKAENADKKTAFLADSDNLFATFKAEFIDFFKLEKTATMSAISSAYNTAYAKQWSDLNSAVDSFIARMFPIGRYFVSDALCGYYIDPAPLDDENVSARAYLEMEGRYDPAKPWYQQYGEYETDDETTEISVLQKDFEYNKRTYNDGTWNSDYTVYTYVPAVSENGTAATFTVTDNKDGTIQVTKDSEAPVLCKFSGYEPLY